MGRMMYLVCIFVLSLVTFGNTSHDIDVQQQISAKVPATSVVTEAIGTTTTTTTATTVVISAAAEQRAIAWLLTQRDPRDFGFHNDTALVLITIQVARSLGFTLPTLEPIEVALSGKQLEVETVVALWRHSVVTPPPHRLALACLALSALCRDPRQFHGHDLIGTLLHNHEEPQQVRGEIRRKQQLQQLTDLEFGYAALAACAAQAHVRKKEVRRLLDIANSPQRHNIDTVAVTIMTLRCIIVHDHRHRNWLHSIRKPSLALARQQMPDGSFGNVYNTALAVQALAAHNNGYWRPAAARRWLELHQDPDGAFTDPALTAMAALALLSRGMDAVRTLAGGGSVCAATYTPSLSAEQHGLSTFTLHGDEGSLDVVDQLDDQNNASSAPPTLTDGGLYYAGNYGGINSVNNVTVTYTLWMGGSSSNASVQNVVASVSITAAHNATFYTVMMLAAELDAAHFAFEASQWPNGHYVHTIAGHREEPMGYHYWLLYRLDDRPDPAHPPGSHQVAPAGVDDLLVEEGDHFLFWYKKL